MKRQPEGCLFDIKSLYFGKTCAIIAQIWKKKGERNMTFLEKFEEIKKIADVDVKFGRDFAIQINLTDSDCSGAFYVEHRSGVLNVEPYDYHDRNALMTIDSALLVKMLTGEADAVASFLAGRFAIDGDVDAVLELKKIADAVKAVKKAEEKAKKEAEKAAKEAKKAEEKAKKEAEKKAKAEAEAKAKAEAEKKAKAEAEAKAKVEAEKKAKAEAEKKAKAEAEAKAKAEAEAKKATEKKPAAKKTATKKAEEKAEKKPAAEKKVAAKKATKKADKQMKLDI